MDVEFQSDTISSLFHRQYYYSDVWYEKTSYLGIPIYKCPLDLWIYQEIIYETRPRIIIETGTYKGASALWLIHALQQVGVLEPQIITIDITQSRNMVKHPNIQNIESNSVEPKLIEWIQAYLEDKIGNVMVILDSDHTQKHVAQELELYAPFVSEGSYLIVEDTNVNGNPVVSEFGPGPHEAVQDFLSTHDEFIVDTEREKFGMTFNPGGYLKRVKCTNEH